VPSTDPLAGFPADAWGVEIVVGPTPERLDHVLRDDGYLQVGPDAFLAVIDDLGRMHVTADRVTVDPLPGHDLAEMAYLVYGWAPRFVRVLREEYVLHASAVTAGDGAVALLGYPGAGKSTTVTGLVQRGHRLIVDDVVPVDVVDDVPWVHGWERPVHLTDEAADRVGIRADERVGLMDDTKLVTWLPVDPDRRPLRAVIELVASADATQVRHRPLRQADRLAALVHHANTSGSSAAGARRESFFAWVTRLATLVDVHRIERPAEGWHLDGVLDAVAAIIDESAGVAGGDAEGVSRA
jgi:hypothetical protein